MNIVDERLARLVRFTSSDPSNVALACDAFDRAMALKDFAAAKMVIQRALSCNAEATVLVYRQGALHLAADEPKQAREIFESLPDYARGEPNLKYMVALSYYCEGNVDRAFAISEPLLAEPGSPPAVLALALRAAHALNQFDSANLLMDRYANMLEFDADAMSVASLIHFDLGNIAVSESLSAQALAIDGGLLEALVASGSIKLLQEDIAQAKTLLERALVARENTGRVWSALGLVSFREGKLEEAIGQLTRATQTMAQHIGTWHALAWCRIVQVRLNDARAYFETALALDRNFAETHGGFAVLHALAAEPAQAKACVSRALRLDPTCVSAKFAQALLSGEVADQASLKRFAQLLLRSNRRHAIRRNEVGVSPTLH